MSKRLFLMAGLLLAVLLALIPASRAQTPPAQINDALADLSARAGRTITLAAMDSWNWTQTNYPDTSLGCPQPGQTYAQVLTNGYQFIFVYNGATFDYRASADGAILFLCSGPATVPPPRVLPTNTPVATAIPVGQAVCEGAMNTRLRAGIQGRVRADGLTVNLRSQPTASAQRLAQMAPGDTFALVGGPQCAESLVWWQITFGALNGWVAEGANGFYWIEPTGTTVTVATPVPAPAGTTPAGSVFSEEPTINSVAQGNLAPIGVANAGALTVLIELPIADTVTAVAWSPDGTTLAVTTASGVRLYSMAALRLPPRVFDVPGGPAADVAFSDEGSLMVTGHADTIVRVWDISTGGLSALLRGHTQPVRAVAFSSDGRLAASASGSDTTNEDIAVHLWDTVNRAQTNVLQGHTGAVTAVAFSPDGSLVASGGLDNTVRLWDVFSGMPGTVLSSHTQPVRAVAFSPDGSWLASAGDDGAIRFWEIGPGEQMTFEGHTDSVRALAFSPDGSLIASASADGTVRLWDLATGAEVARLDAPGAVEVAFRADGLMLAFVTTQGQTSLIRMVGVAP
jgi:hypothetical protein